MENKPKILAIAGPTASGKSDLAIELAKEFNGEVISADSRQIYKGLDIGTEKITAEEMESIPHHCLDIADPKEVFTTAQFKECAEKEIKKIFKKDKLPVLAGGTGFYIEAVVDNLNLPEVEPNLKLREKLSKFTNEELMAKLKEMDHKRSEEVDPNNRRRVIRAIEIANKLGKVPPKQKGQRKYNPLKIGIRVDDGTLREKIDKRAEHAFERGLIEETKNLKQEKGIPSARIQELGLEYRIVNKYLESELNHKEMKEELKNKVWQYAKRQKTWLKRDEEIEWFSLDKKDDIEKRVQEFLN